MKVYVNALDNNRPNTEHTWISAYQNDDVQNNKLYFHELWMIRYLNAQMKYCLMNQNNLWTFQTIL